MSGIGTNVTLKPQGVSGISTEQELVQEQHLLVSQQLQVILISLLLVFTTTDQQIPRQITIELFATKSGEFRFA